MAELAVVLLYWSICPSLAQFGLVSFLFYKIICIKLNYFWFYIVQCVTLGIEMTISISHKLDTTISYILGLSIKQLELETGLIILFRQSKNHAIQFLKSCCLESGVLQN